MSQERQHTVNWRGICTDSCLECNRKKLAVGDEAKKLQSGALSLPPKADIGAQVRVRVEDVCWFVTQAESIYALRNPKLRSRMMVQAREATEELVKLIQASEAE